MSDHVETPEPFSAAGQVDANQKRAGTDGSEDDLSRVERELKEIRGDLGGLVEELDHRWHRLNPIAIARRYPWRVAIAGLALAGLTAGTIVMYRSKRQARESWTSRGHRLKEALGRAVDKPDRVAQDQGGFGFKAAGLKVLTGAATALAAMAVRRFAAKLFAPKPARPLEITAAPLGRSSP